MKCMYWFNNSKLHRAVMTSLMTDSPGVWSLSGAFRPSAALHQARACLCSEATAPSAGDRAKKTRIYEPMSWNEIRPNSLQWKPCTLLPRLTKNRLAAFTVGVSGNFSDRIPGENRRLKRFFLIMMRRTNGCLGQNFKNMEKKREKSCVFTLNTVIFRKTIKPSKLRFKFDHRLHWSKHV